MGNRNNICWLSRARARAYLSAVYELRKSRVRVKKHAFRRSSFCQLLISPDASLDSQAREFLLLSIDLIPDISVAFLSLARSSLSLYSFILSDPHFCVRYYISPFFYFIVREYKLLILFHIKYKLMDSYFSLQPGLTSRITIGNIVLSSYRTWFKISIRVNPTHAVSRYLDPFLFLSMYDLMHAPLKKSISNMFREKIICYFDEYDSDLT